MNIEVADLFRIIGELTAENRVLLRQIEELTPPEPALRPLSDTAKAHIREALQ